MNSRSLTATQVFLRIGLSLSFLSAVADLFGLWGKPGSQYVSWGNWQNFLVYSQQVNSYANPQFNNWLAIIATILETLLPAFLLVGYKIKWTAFASGLLLVGFALSMTISFGIKSSLDYSVWTGAAAALLLSCFDTYRYSIDQYLQRS